MSSIHAVWIVFGSTTPLSFSKIIASYRSQPQADPRVCYDIMLTEDPDPHSKGDIIAFYNGCFVPVMEPFIRTLGANSGAARADAYDLQAVVALPLPELKSNRVHSPRRVGLNTSVTVSPISESRRTASQSSARGSPNSKKNMSYAFHSSPSKNLDAINVHVANQSPQKGIVRPREGDSTSNNADADSNIVKRPKVMKPPATAANSNVAENHYLSVAKASSAMPHGSPLKASYSMARASVSPPTTAEWADGILDDPMKSRPPAAVLSTMPISPEMGVAPLAVTPQKTQHVD